MIYGLGLIGALALMWWILSGHTEPLIVGFGVASVAFSAGLAWRMLGQIDRECAPYVLMHRLMPYWGWLGGEIARANLAVIRLALRPDLDLTPRFVRTPMAARTDLGSAVFANSITLTPGTVSIEIEQGDILVHALDASLADPAGFEEMARRSCAAADHGDAAK